LVVMDTASLDEYFGFEQRVEDFSIEQFIA
jgi:hypothetical protein